MRITIVAYAIVFSLAASQVTSANSIARCIQEINSTRRLECFDAHAASVLSKRNITKPNWEVTNEKDPITDYQNMSLIGRPNFSPYTSSSEYLELRCNNGELDAILHLNNYIAEDRIVSVIRFDNDRPFEMDWYPSSSRRSIGLWSDDLVMPFIVALKYSKKIAFRIKLKLGTTTLVFDLTGMPASFDSLRQNCEKPQQ